MCSKQLQTQTQHKKKAKAGHPAVGRGVQMRSVPSSNFMYCAPESILFRSPHNLHDGPLPRPMTGYSRALGAVLVFIASVSRIDAFILSSRRMVSCSQTHRINAANHPASARRARRRARISMDDEIARKGIKEVWTLTALSMHYWCRNLTTLACLLSLRLCFNLRREPSCHVYTCFEKGVEPRRCDGGVEASCRYGVRGAGSFSSCCFSAVQKMAGAGGARLRRKVCHAPVSRRATNSTSPSLLACVSFARFIHVRTSSQQELTTRDEYLATRFTKLSASQHDLTPLTPSEVSRPSDKSLDYIRSIFSFN